MTIVVIDFRMTRRTEVARLTGANPSSVFKTCPEGIAAVARPCLALWHVGYEQNREEAGQLRAQLELFLKTCQSWVAAYTGGQVPRNLLPEDSDHFVVRGDAGPDVAPTGAFRKAIEATVANWNDAAGAFLPGQLQRVWGGRDPVAEAKLSVLCALFAGLPPSHDSVQVLQRSYPWIEETIAALPPGDSLALESLRKRLLK